MEDVFLKENLDAYHTIREDTKYFEVLNFSVRTPSLGFSPTFFQRDTVTPA
jgi:hypothetical protein